ncbi:hypothetical protein TNCV_3992381 [Trichonephila clavipes]|uniref:Uncharacterized protein n=1 Tax=Trichonephila clavipes TaxID=2585209 RepID=A0A8X6SW93_TRICX|nr:hypothetical protein TNCV_3992381 [Trichonephila clavipes]
MVLILSHLQHYHVDEYGFLSQIVAGDIHGVTFLNLKASVRASRGNVRLHHLQRDQSPCTPVLYFCKVSSKKNDVGNCPIWIVRIAPGSGSADSPMQCKAKCQCFGTFISADTVAYGAGQHMQQSHIQQHPPCGSLLTKRYGQLRREYSQKYCDLTINKWKRISYLDESFIPLMGVCGSSTVQQLHTNWSSVFPNENEIFHQDTASRLELDILHNLSPSHLSRTCGIYSESSPPVLKAENGATYY